MRVFSSSTIALLAVVCVALLLATTTFTFAAAASPSSSPASSHTGKAALPPFVAQVTTAVADALAPLASTLAPFIPTPVRTLAPPFVQGAVSLVMVGREARRPPASVNGAAGDEVLQHTTAKFLFAAGAIAAELTLLKLLYREPYRNLRRNPMNRRLCHPAGFVLLVLLTAIPNDLVDTSLVLIFLWRLSAAVYSPAIVCGQLLRVYLTALVPRLPHLSAAYTLLLTYWDVTEDDQSGNAGAGATAVSSSEAWAEVVMAVVVAFAVLFCVAARRGAGGPSKPREAESDGDDYYEE